MAEKLNEEIIVTFPQMGNYSHAFKFIFERGFGVKYMTPPPITKRTLELGSRYSPDYVCVPFKYCLGCYLEALEKGANCLMQIFGACRLNYFGELSQQILTDLGFKFQFMNMAEIKWTSPRSIIDHMKIINPNVSLPRVVKALPTTMNMIKLIDEFDDNLRHNIGFEVNEGDFERLEKEFYAALDTVENGKQLKRLKKDFLHRMKQIPLNKPAKTLKVGMIGDYYTVQEPFSNYYMEKELAAMGMEVYRDMNFTNTIVSNKWHQRHRYAKKYAKFNLGATTTFSIAEALSYVKHGMDGVIQVKSFGCTPEVDAMPILHNISNDYHIPILNFSFDSQTSETGIKTRLEAFYDMVVARKNTAKGTK
ncbi:MAG: hypothetical protein NC133_03130 [Prevotella sp.]|nr:hypothetical protein [Prevotella sp.]